MRALSVTIAATTMMLAGLPGIVRLTHAAEADGSPTRDHSAAGAVRINATSCAAFYASAARCLWRIGHDPSASDYDRKTITLSDKAIAQDRARGVSDVETLLQIGLLEGSFEQAINRSCTNLLNVTEQYAGGCRAMVGSP